MEISEKTPGWQGVREAAWMTPTAQTDDQWEMSEAAQRWQGGRDPDLMSPTAKG